MKTITLTGYRRPHLFRDTLVSLAANDLTGWQIVIRIEPSPSAPEFAEIAASVLHGHPHSLTVNETLLGVRMNPFRTIEAAFAQGSSLNLCLEEDLLLAPDATALALWFEQNHRPEWLCLCLLAGPCGSAAPLSNPRFPDLLFAAKTFNSLGFAVRPQEWEKHFRPAWFRDQTNLGMHYMPIPPRGWDWSICASVVADPALVTVQPVLARANHTGREDGRHTRQEFHDRAFSVLPLATGSHTPVLADVKSLPHEVRSHIYAFEELTAARLELARRRRPGKLARLLSRWHR